MDDCFYDCANLTQVPTIPARVKILSACFYNCSKITKVTLKCNYNAGQFNSAFSNCTALTAGKIKVPAGEVDTYKANALYMHVQADWFIANN